jgi:hypothetical protein
MGQAARQRAEEYSWTRFETQFLEATVRVQLSLGHASIRTTERYRGVEQDLTDAPCDRLGFRLS